jgi:hypothetical protein
MMKRNRGFLMAFISFIVLTSNGGAVQAVPLNTAFSYQGRLTENGQPANGIYDFQFRLLDAESGGSQVGLTVYREDVAVSKGLFVIPQLDFGGGTINGESRWLEVGVRPGDTTEAFTLLMPNQLLAAVPYALYALNTSSVLGTSTPTALEFKVNNARALLISPAFYSPNIIGGSAYNLASAGVSGVFIGGGGSILTANRVYDSFGTICGGAANQAGDGNGSIDDRAYATVCGGGLNSAIGAFSTVSGGHQNNALGLESSIGGGFNNGTVGSHTAVAGGDSNSAINDADAVGGGRSNLANGGRATVSGGFNNTASGRESFVGGGIDNEAGGDRATISGGFTNVASGNAAVIPGGAENLASGAYSFAAGAKARATHPGSFVWGSGAENTSSFGDYTFTVRAHGGAKFFSASGTESGVELAAGGSSFSGISDRRVKDNFKDPDPKRILETVTRLPVPTWNLKSQSSEIRHIGPVAQDFNEAFAYLFGQPESPVHINSMDAVGVSLGAIQGLYQVVKEKEGQITSLQEQINRLQASLKALEQVLTGPSR